MGIQYIDGKRFYRSLSAGIRRLLSRQDYLNKINVFPVPDSDTGTNMGFTMSSIESSFKIENNISISQAAEGIAELTINNARGNSGAILAQFFTGFSEGVKKKNKLTPSEFSHALQIAKQYSYDALMKPKEGTILTVISDWINAIHKVSSNITDFKKLLTHGLNEALISLSKTPEKLDVLSKAGVVDAGAQGFVDILEGINNFIYSGIVEELTTEAITETPSVIESISFNEKYRFCTECLISGNELDRSKLKSKLTELGDSIVVAGSSSRMKVHIHTDHPKKVIHMCQNFGTVSDEKADDMIRQQHDAHGTHQETAVLVDSGCDLPEDILRKYNIHMIPVRLNFGPEHFVDKMTITSGEFWEKLEMSPHHPQTSQPTPGDFLRQYQLLSSHYKQTISIHIPENVSGTYQSARLASEKLSSMPISVIDSHNGSIGLGLIAIRIAEAIIAGKTIDEIHTIAKEAIENTTLYIGLETLDFAVRGGRLPASVKKVADLIKINPILSFTSKGIKPVGKTFGRKNIMEKFNNYVQKTIDWNQPLRIGISHANCEEKALKFRDNFIQKVGKENVFVSEVGPGLGAHAGPGAMVISIQTLFDSLNG
ncbi:MAG: DegV family protein [Candidatus Marinimicrobia bacterium]|nr:DegV family protein [Candidatus Neomarinimicrobiota bacterium]